jgi:hypothetical protein
MNIISKYLSKIFTIKRTTHKYYYSYLYKLNKEPHISLNLSVYSVDLTLHTSHEMRLYYARYSYNNSSIDSRFNSKSGGPFYNIPINLVPIDDSGDILINGIGLFKHYINAGMYICKIFDYKEQIETLVRDSELYHREAGPYMFIGDLYSHMFPYTEIHS